MGLQACEVWTADESRKLLRLIEEHGGTRWKTIQRAFPTRTIASLRNKLRRMTVRPPRSANRKRNRCSRCGHERLGHVCPMEEEGTGDAATEDEAIATEAPVTDDEARIKDPQALATDDEALATDGWASGPSSPIQSTASAAPDVAIHDSDLWAVPYAFNVPPLAASADYAWRSRLARELGFAL